jgi:NTP pyrophosphatase (non-canonical NTP hydrolase)
MEIKKLQELSSKVTDLIDTKRKGLHDSDTTIIHIYEELGEVSRQLYNQKIGRSHLDLKNLAEEISDCMLLLMHLSRLYNFDVEKEMLEKINDLKKRHPDLDWREINKDL